MSSRTDLFDDEMQPFQYEQGTLYRVVAPQHNKDNTALTHDNTHFASLLVDEHDYVQMIDWRWGDERKVPASERTESQFATESEIYEWLKEWELVELRAIGPEDSEFFATDKLRESK